MSQDRRFERLTSNLDKLQTEIEAGKIREFLALAASLAAHPDSVMPSKEKAALESIKTLLRKVRNLTPDDSLATLTTEITKQHSEYEKAFGGHRAWLRNDVELACSTGYVSDQTLQRLTEKILGFPRSKNQRDQRKSLITDILAQRFFEYLNEPDRERHQIRDCRLLVGEIFKYLDLVGSAPSAFFKSEESMRKFLASCIPHN